MSQRIIELDVFRGIAALIVVVFHYTSGSIYENDLYDIGVTGVELFFMISGFVIYMTISKTTSPITFAIHRFARLYPVYWLCVSLSIILQLFFNETSKVELTLVNYIANMSMFQYFLKIPDLEGAYWTLTIELIFYGFISIFLFIKKINFFYPFLLLILILTLINEYYFTSFIPNANYVYIYIPLLAHLPLFIAGITFYKIKTLNKVNRQLIYYYGILLICFFSQLIFHNHNVRLAHVIGYHWAIVAYFIFFILLVHKKISLKNVKPLIFIGSISYPLYLIHHFIGTKILIPLISEYTNFEFAFLISIIIVITISYYISIYIEVPSRKWIKKHYNQFVINNSN